jgi:thiamine-monophosphate kinase
MSVKITSEEDLIQRYMAPLAAANPGALGLLDDCAVQAVSAGCELVMKTDAIAEGIHFLPTDPPADIGWKALAVNVSDLAAKGARPLSYLISLSFPAPPDATFMAAFTAGLGEAQAAFGIQLAGGDTDRRPGPMTFTPFVVGEVATGRMVRRAAARPGDILYVSGTLGDATLGLCVLTDPIAADWGLAPPGTAHLISRYRRPQPRLALRQALLSCARAAMDLSDGLAKDLARMAKASGIAAVIEATRLPLSAPAACALAADPTLMTRIVTGGDDYEILAAVPPDRAQAFETAAARDGVEVTAIGHCLDGNGITIVQASGPLTLTRLGYDHF